MAKGGMGNIMKQAQMMQANLQKAQSELANIDVEGAAGNGMIKITISCKHEIKKINIDRINSNLIEAAEQCNFNNIPEVSEVFNFNYILDNWEKFFEDRKVIFCDENSRLDVFEILNNQKNKVNNKWAIIVGPEGGFSDFERSSIDNKNNTMSISLGPRIIRSDTAVVAILAIFQMIIGDWKK